MSLKDIFISTKDWYEKGSWANVQGLSLFFQREGRGEVLLLLHAYPTASYGWYKIWEPFTHRYECIAPDLIGNGFSDKPASFSYHIPDLCDIISEWLTHLGITEYHLLAHAYGVSAAQELLARQVLDEGRNSARIKSICFLSGAIFSELAHVNRMQKFLLSPLGRRVAQLFPTPYPAFKKNFARTFGPNTQPSEIEMRQYWHLLTYNEGHKRVPQVIYYLSERLLHRDRWVEAMKKAELPLGFINAIHDPILGEPMSLKWEEELPNAFLSNLSKPMGHYPPLEEPELVISSYEAFRNELESK